MDRRTCDRLTAVHLPAQHARQQLLSTPVRRVRRRKTTWQVSAAVFLVLWGVLGVAVALREAFDVERITRTVYTATGTGNLDAAPTNTSLAGNCSPPAIGRFPGDLFTQAQRRQGAVILHVIASLYMFLALAIICDDYFVPALERISEALRLQPDVAGATFMAAGSSAPELFTSIFGVFISQDDIGVGTIVGSAVFNLLFIVGLCGLMVGTVRPVTHIVGLCGLMVGTVRPVTHIVGLCGLMVGTVRPVTHIVGLCGLMVGTQAITLTLWPLLRDCSIYLISVAALVIVMYDEQVHWYEACVLVCLYCLYVVLMYFNRQLSSGFNRRFPAATVDPQNRRQSGQYEKTPLIKAGFASEKTAEEGDAATDDEIWSSDIMKDRLSKFSAPRQTQEQNAAEEVQFLETPPSGAVTTHSDEAVGPEPESPFSVPSQPWRRVLWVVGLPLTALLWGTVPDCRRDRWRRWYPVSFLMSVVWIGVFTYILVWTVTVIGFTVGIPDTVMGLTLIAIGTSVPDAISSVLVSKEGEGDMAVSNAVGSNVFDILVGLGVPWLVRTAVVQTNRKLERVPVVYQTCRLGSRPEGPLNNRGFDVFEIEQLFDVFETEQGFDVFQMEKRVDVFEIEQEQVFDVFEIEQGFDVLDQNGLHIELYNTVYSVSPEVPARPRVGSPDDRRPEGDPIRGRAGTEGDAEYTVFVVPIQSGGLVYSAVTLLSTVLVLLFIMWLNRWRLDRRLGVICSCLYAVFITLATLYELNVFGHFSLPTCLGN
ncbi:hypothetical protein Bbelb_401750 [Branchiostoma belcheri]|nr:hypothetical protein Bbelb_401750 [Branchiostoma belcheri]